MEHKVKKVPMRQCLGCNEHRPKIELMRVVRTPEGETVLDFTGKRSGRGAYVCKKLSCLRKARKSKRLEKNLACDISDEVYDKMESEISQYE